MYPTVPIAVFTYKRLQTLEKTIAALKENDLAIDSSLYIFSDGPKHQNDEAKIKEVRAYLKTISGFREIKILESEGNNGLAKSIITGVGYVLKQHDRVIVMEDDLIASANFLAFMNSSLKLYENSKNVFSVSGYSFNLKYDKHAYKYDGYFFGRGWSWGWGTWRDRWELVDWDVKDYQQFQQDRSAQKSFAKGGSDLNKMLRSQIAGKVDSWAIRWFYHQYKVEGMTFYPTESKILNLGFDEMATHTKGSDRRYRPKFDDGIKKVFHLPNASIEHHPLRKAFLRKLGVRARVRSKMETVISLVKKKLRNA